MTAAPPPSSSGSEHPRVPVDAIVNLVNHQQQCDEDGVMVQVSRQALAEVLVYVTEVRPDNKWAHAPQSASVAQRPVDSGITDAMCEAAVKADQVDRIQGFTYKTHHVIRDVWSESGQQKVWEINKDDADAEAKFYHQCRIERMRKVLEAAYALPSTSRGTEA